MFRTLLQLLYPQGCAVCGAPGPDLLCAACRARIPVRTMEGCCELCGKTLLDNERAAGTAAPVCHACRARRPSFAFARSASAFQGPVRDLVHRLKYDRGVRLAEPLAELLHGCCLAHFASERPDLTCPVPLHRERMRSRGYNQSALLARALARRLCLPFVPDLLRRVRDTPTQTRMDASARRANVAGAFRVPDRSVPIAFGTCVLLVDDVMTTGATFEAASAALREAGAERILCLSVARD